MKRKVILKCVVIAGAIMSIGQQTTLATPTAEMLSNSCAGCHGTNGDSNGPAIPSLAGLSKPYLVESMESYKDGSRPSTIMDRIAKGYSQEEFELMGDFFAKQKVHKISKQKFNQANVKSGKKLHNKYCKKCHESGGTDPEDDAGQLLGNARLYLEYTFADLADKSRSMDKKMTKKMKKMLKKDPKASVKLIDYYSKGEK